MSDTRRFIELDAKARLAASIVLIMLPITSGISAWTFTALWDHESRIGRLEATSYTKDEAAELRGELKDLLGEIRESLSAIRADLKHLKEE